MVTTGHPIHPWDKQPDNRAMETIGKDIIIKRGVFFSWFSLVLQKGNEEPLEVADLPVLPSTLDAASCARSFALAAGVLGATNKSWLLDTKVSISPLVWVIIRRHWGDLLKITFLKALGVLLGFAGPLLTGEMVSFFDNKSAYSGLIYGLGLVALLFLTSFLGTVVNANSNMRSLEIKLSISASLSYIVYFRSTTLPLAGWNDLQFTEAQVNNFLQVDVDQVSPTVSGLPATHRMQLSGDLCVYDLFLFSLLCSQFWVEATHALVWLSQGQSL